MGQKESNKNHALFLLKNDKNVVYLNSQNITNFCYILIIQNLDLHI